MPPSIPDFSGLFPALATVLLPGAVGAWLGRRVAPKDARVRLGWALGVVAGGLAVALSPPVLGRVQTYDALLAALVFGASFAFAAALPVAGAWKRAAVAGTSLLLGLVALEIVASLLPPPAVALPPASGLRLVRDGVADRRCGATTDRFVPPAREGSTKRVVHVGDSMVNPEDVPAETTFLARLRVAQPTVDHVNFGIAGTGPDAYLVQVRKRVPLVGAKQAVVHVFLGNDFFDLDRRYTCCGNERLVGEEADGFPLQCEVPFERVSTWERLRTERPPTVLLQLAQGSDAARLLAATLVRGGAAASWQLSDWEPTAPQVDRLVALVLTAARELGAQGLDTRVVLLPPRWSLEKPRADDPFVPARDRLLAACRGAGLRVFDAWPLFAGALASDGTKAWFHPSPGNPHLGVDGHGLYARWLQDEVLP